RLFSQLFANVLWFQQLNSLDEFRLLDATITNFVPVGENFLQIFHSQLFEIHRLKINRLFCMRKGEPKEKNKQIANRTRHSIIPYRIAARKFVDPFSSASRRSFQRACSNSGA